MGKAIERKLMYPVVVVDGGCAAASVAARRTDVVDGERSRVSLPARRLDLRCRFVNKLMIG